MVIHGSSPSQLALRRMWKSVLMVVFYQAFAYLAKLARPLRPAVTAATTPYYASCNAGILTILDGPTSYILAVLALDYIYAVFSTSNLLASSPDKPSYFITTKTCFRIAKLLVVVVECWMLTGVRCSWLIAIVLTISEARTTAAPAVWLETFLAFASTFPAQMYALRRILSPSLCLRQRAACVYRNTSSKTSRMDECEEATRFCRAQMSYALVPTIFTLASYPASPSSLLCSGIRPHHLLLSAQPTPSRKNRPETD
ncbi:hypothetical protein BJ912DRAFT_931881 [Pholiota molesta]|nr:hypothetical protein BJ912DRAFT_931881 [Pholiota molesta]